MRGRDGGFQLFLSFLTLQRRHPRRSHRRARLLRLLRLLLLLLLLLLVILPGTGPDDNASAAGRHRGAQRQRADGGNGRHGGVFLLPPGLGCDGGGARGRPQEGRGLRPA